VDKGGAVRAGDYILFYGNGNENYNWRQDYLYTTEQYQQLREFISDRVSYLVLRGHWCNIIVLNVQEPSEEKSDDSKDSFYEVFDLFAKFHTKIPLGDFNTKLGKEDIFKPTIGNESLHQNRNDNAVRLVNFATTNI